MHECITIQVGQCGNQIGNSFWNLLLQEHARCAKDGLFSEGMSTFFRNVDTRVQPCADIRGDGPQPIRYLKARSLLIDTEEGVLSSILAGPLRELFDESEIVSAVSGAGNNFAHGHYEYGPKYHEKISESIRKVVEPCDSLQAFFLVHSLGGGTGSGLGTYILSMLEDQYPSIFRFTTSVFPSSDDDVLRDHADCVFPVENQCLLDICYRMKLAEVSGSRIVRGVGPTVQYSKRSEKPFDKMNSIAAQLMSNITSCSRFEGELNVDLSEISTNLVPYPKVNFLCSSLSPFLNRRDIGSTGSLGFDRAFKAVFSRENHLCSCDPVGAKYLACALLVRGRVNLSDINRNVASVTRNLDFAHWNQQGMVFGVIACMILQGFKIGHCNMPSTNAPYSILCLSNNSSIRSTFGSMEKKFKSLYTRKKAFVHHYTKYVEESAFTEAISILQEMQSEYSELQLNGIITKHILKSHALKDARQKGYPELI